MTLLMRVIRRITERTHCCNRQFPWMAEWRVGHQLSRWPTQPRPVQEHSNRFTRKPKKSSQQFGRSPSWINVRSWSWSLWEGQIGSQENL